MVSSVGKQGNVCNLYPTSRIKTIDNHLNMRYMRIYFRGPYS